jgi:hypothetical protein
MLNPKLSAKSKTLSRTINGALQRIVEGMISFSKGKTLPKCATTSGARYFVLVAYGDSLRADDPTATAVSLL